MKILSVKEFNIQANERYENAIKRFQLVKGGFPSRSMYVFQTPEGYDRKRGFVVIEREDSYKFYLTRKELNEAIAEFVTN